ncbi:hypothetical protein [Allocoleopsis sp.]
MPFYCHQILGKLAETINQSLGRPINAQDCQDVFEYTGKDWLSDCV